MTKPKATNRKKLVAFVLPIIRKAKLPMSEELEKLRHKAVCCGAEADRSQAQGDTIAERAETADQKRENPLVLQPCRNVGNLFEKADRPDR